MNMIPSAQGKEKSATRDCYLRLRHLILTGEMPPGKKLKIEELRALLKTGASPVREALSLLTSDMLVERIDQRGFRAAPVSKSNFQEILMLRCALEDMALRASIANANTKWEERIVLAHHRMPRTDRNETELFEEVHKDFHLALINNSNMPTLQRYCEQLYDLNIRYRYLAADGPRYGERSVAKEHEEIFDATIKRDADAASALLISHYRRTGEYFISQMDN